MVDNDVEDDRDKVNKMRLKTNKVNLIQALNVDEEFLSDLMRNKVIYYEEAIETMKGKSREERAKLLINCLINKTHAKKDWYTRFRSLLQQKNYNSLIIFLDNTIIKKPKFISKFQGTFYNHHHQDSMDSQFLSSEINYQINSFRSANSIRSININIHDISEKNFDYLLKRLPTYSSKPIYLIKELESSKDAEDTKQLALEHETFDAFKKLELLYSLYQSDRDSFKDSFFLDTKIVRNVLNSFYPHLNMKYYRHLYDTFNIDILKFLSDNLVERLRMQKIIRLTFYSSLDELVHKLVWVLIRNEKFSFANEVLIEFISYINFLDDYLDKINNENNNLNKDVSASSSNDTNILLTAKFYALTNLVIVKNNLYEFKTSYDIFNRAIDLMEQCERSKYNYFSFQSEFYKSYFILKMTKK